MTHFILRHIATGGESFHDSQPQCPDGYMVIEADGPCPLPKTTVYDVKAEAQRRILAAYPLWKQVNAALGLYDAARVQSMTAYINAVRLASDEIEGRLDDDLNLDPATQPDWP